MDARGEGVVALPPACQALLAGALQRSHVGCLGPCGTQRCDIAVLLFAASKALPWKGTKHWSYCFLHQTDEQMAQSAHLEDHAGDWRAAGVDHHIRCRLQALVLQCGTHSELRM